MDTWFARFQIQVPRRFGMDSDMSWIYPVSPVTRTMRRMRAAMSIRHYPVVCLSILLASDIQDDQLMHARYLRVELLRASAYGLMPE